VAPSKKLNLRWSGDRSAVEDPIQATIRLEVARHHVTHYLSNKIREYSQWFRRADNTVADALSRDNDRTDEELTQIRRFHCPSSILMMGHGRMIKNIKIIQTI